MEVVMKKIFLLYIMILLTMLFISSCGESTAPLTESSGNEEISLAKGKMRPGTFGHIVVANRASGTISVVDVKSDQLSGTFSLPSDPNIGEPMYVVYVPQVRRVFVGDRANDQVVVFRATDFSVEATVPVGRGVFHMWADLKGKQLWVNNDIDNTSTIIDPVTLQVLGTTPTPADLVSMGGKPHDVILDPLGNFAYVTVLGIAGPSDYVVQYSTRNFQEINRAAVGQDPHLSLTARNNLLYVPCQNSDAVFVLNRHTMQFVKEIPVPGAHGAGMPLHGKVFYTTNLPGGGTDGLFAINTLSNQVIGSSDTPFPVPHNIALPPSAEILYLTHSGGTSDKLTVYKISDHNPLPQFLKEVTVGLNPFGLSWSE
jgi:DNA-binding beta-propeller fold protein YncE